MVFLKNPTKIIITEAGRDVKQPPGCFYLLSDAAGSMRDGSWSKKRGGPPEGGGVLGGGWIRGFGGGEWRLFLF